MGKMKKLFGFLLCAVVGASILGFTGCTDPKPNWWEERDKIVATVTLEGATPEEYVVHITNREELYGVKFTHPYTGEKIDQKIKLSFTHDGVEKGAFKLDTRYLATPTEGLSPVKWADDPGNYDLMFSFYRNDNFVGQERISYLWIKLEIV